ncbi:nitric oxide synthase-interacting protein homolog [Tribolium castaneum]|uniref:Nitric oxide synthase-interacting protein homolog n=1 Tax=Tribolium castaneum TaxID=7070 RepID=D6WHA6_TRICA|nr:PREDICTED: nitric oxide synthase-interacting protein homolog [Tribolium castaneum]EFA00996.1 Nitric oxide synthase-interacting protein homolog-like Protein [Tribolium castaneum]|eukprot:XP_966634.1 PREDICTED: nitric oxide synthase-interacting protein homolog [Tribolium castaneum]
MTRHARNCTAGAVYTYHEKKKDAQASGYGTNAQRLGKDSIKDFDCCCLSLQPCRNPVITKDGYLFDKEVILEYIIAKKNENSRKLKEYERLKKKEDEENLDKATAETNQKVEQFLKGENSIISKPKSYFKSDNEPSTSSISNMAVGRDKELPSFWVPSKTPTAEKIKLQKPDNVVLCPISGKPLKVKDLIDVKFTPIKDSGDKKSLIAKECRYMCAVTHDVLSNSVPCAVLKPTGDVVTLECVEKIIKKDWIHPLTSKKLTEKDIIVMQRGGTGYAQTNVELEAKQERPALQA